MSIVSISNGESGSSVRTKLNNSLLAPTFLSNVIGYLGTAGVADTYDVATQIDKIPTTTMSVGERVSAIVTISGTQRRLYTAELVVPADATANIEVSPSVIRPNDFNVSTNNKVWREIKNSGIIDVSNYGVVPGAVFVSDQVNAIITAATAGDSLIFPAGDYNVYGMTISKRLTLIGYGARFISPASNLGVFSVTQDLVSIEGFSFLGQGRSLNATYPNQIAIRITGCSNVKIQNCFFDGYPADCIQTNATHISDTSSDFGGINIVNCHMMRSHVGFKADTRGEYVNISGCTITDCNTGAYIKAGNINFNGCQITDCSTVGVDLVTDTNDAHGIFSGCQINHNVLSIRGVSIANGHFFRGCNIYYGDMNFTSCTGISFDACTIEGLEMKFDGCTGCKVADCTVPGVGGTVTLTTNWNSNQSDVFADNNKNFSNNYPIGWNTVGTVNTTNATVTTLRIIPTTTNSVIHISATVKARRTGGVAGSAGDGASYVIYGTFTNNAGTVTQIGTTTVSHVAESQAGWDCVFDISTTTVRIRVTGAADNDVTWDLGMINIY